MTRIRHSRHDLQGQRSRSQDHVIGLSPVGTMAHKLKRKRIVVVSPKLAGGYPMTRATLRASFKVKMTKVRVTGRLTQTHRMCHIFQTVRPKNFKICVGMEDVDAHQQQAP